MQALPDISGAGHSDQVRVARADDDLRMSLVALATLTTSQLQLRGLLTRVAQSAVSAIPGADGAGLTLLRAGHAATVVASTPFVAEIDAIQCRINEGPCITSTTRARTVHSGTLAMDRQWPQFGRRIEHLGVHSALSIPLRTPQGVLGTMTAYAYASHAFDKRGIRIGELFAVPAAIAVANARVLAEARLLANQLKIGLSQQAAIDQATGILMSRLGCTAEEAVDHLRRTRQTDDESLHTIALRVVADAISRSTKRGRGRLISGGSARSDLSLSVGPRDATHAVLVVGGTLTAVTADVLTKALRHHLESGHRYVQLDVSKLLSCDRDGVLAIVDAHHAFIATGGTLVLVGARTALRQLLRLLGVDTVVFLARARRGSTGRWPT